MTTYFPDLIIGKGDTLKIDGNRYDIVGHNGDMYTWVPRQGEFENRRRTIHIDEVTTQVYKSEEVIIERK